MFQRLVAQRTLIGWLALFALSVGIGACLWDSDQRGGAGGNLLRVGLVLGTLWLALPTQFVAGTMSVSVWKSALVLGVMMVLVRRPFVVIPVLVVLGALSLFARPRR